MSGDPADEPDGDGLADAARRHRERERRWRTEGEPSMMRFIGQIGLLGWIVVSPMLLGLFIGRWLDRTFGTGIFWSAPLLMVGVVFGCWSAWRWMRRV